MKTLSGLLARLPRPSADHRSAGDRARDASDWPAAEASYRMHLAGRPDDAPIWVQLGHSQKEQGRRADAEASYGRAADIDPADPDVRLQLGHLLKDLGRHGDAADAYAASFAISPTLDAAAGMEACGADAPQASMPAARDATLIEVDDLLGYLDAHPTVSGIQRVQLGVIQHVLESEGVDGGGRHAFVLNPAGSGRMWRIRGRDLAALASYVSGLSVDHGRLREAVARCRGGAEAIEPAAGMAYLVLGAFWGHGGVAGRYAAPRRAGMRIGVLVYDIIPITHPEHCDERLSHDFALSFADAMSSFDFVLTISEFTAGEVRRYLARHGLPALPVEAVPLAHSDALRHGPPPASWGRSIAHLRGRPFALMVSTIESRKNHAYLVSAWKHMMDEGLDPPDLVFVGRHGWRVQGLMDAIASLDRLDGRLHVVHDLSDRDLGTLYSACLFTLFPSLVEGWGLPVGEGLAHGRPCIASSTSSIPEVGGGLVDYVDPLNLRDGIPVIRRMAFDRQYRDRRAAEVRAGLVLRDWRAVGADLLDRVEGMRPSLSGTPPRGLRLEPGVVVRPSSTVFGNPVPADYPARPTRLALGDGWFAAEPFGAWMRGSEGELSFSTPLQEGTEAIVYLQVVAPYWATAENVLSVVVGPPPPGPEAPPRARPPRAPKGDPVRTDAPRVVRASGLVGPGGAVHVALSLAGHIPREGGDSPDGRRFAVGLKAMGYAARADAASRADVSEGIAFG